MKFALRGRRTKTGKTVFLNGRQLTPEKSQAIINHSPDGFNWGYGGSGPAQLALAVLLELHNEEFAVYNYMEFKNDIISNLGNTDFDVCITYHISDGQLIIDDIEGITTN